MYKVEMVLERKAKQSAKKIQPIRIPFEPLDLSFYFHPFLIFKFEFGANSSHLHIVFSRHFLYKVGVKMLRVPRTLSGNEADNS